MPQRHKPADIPAGLRARREALGLSRKLVAQAMAIDISTVQRWELPADSKHHRRISADDHARLLAYYDDVEAGRGSDSGSVPRATYTEATALPVSAAAPQPEMAHIVGEIARAGARLRLRSRERAPADELARLRRSLEAAVNNGLEAASGDPGLVHELTLALTDFITVDTAPPEAPAAQRTQPTRARGAS